MKRRKDAVEESVGPAKLHAFHVQRELGRRARGWRNIGEDPLTFMFERGQLARGDARFTAQDRYEAGTQYRAWCEMLARSGRDSTDVDVVSGAAPADTFDQLRIYAIHRLAAIDAALKPRDKTILRRLCGEGWKPSEAVRDALGHAHYDKAVVVRVAEALDALIDAMRAARKHPERLPKPRPVV